MNIINNPYAFLLKKQNTGEIVDLSKGSPGFGYGHCVLLSEGEFSKVYLCQDGNVRKVVKCYVSNNKNYSEKDFYGEIKNLSLLAYKHKEFFLRPDRRFDYFGLPDGEDSIGWYYSTDYCKYGNLGQIIGGNLSTDDFIYVAMDVLFVLFLIHKNNIIHGDVKPENIIFANEGDRIFATLIDFGSSVVEGDIYPKGGTVKYISPGRSVTNIPSKSDDIWAWMVVCAEIIYGSRLVDNFEKDFLLRIFENSNLPVGVKNFFIKLVIEDGLSLDGERCIKGLIEAGISFTRDESAVGEKIGYVCDKRMYYTWDRFHPAGNYVHLRCYGHVNVVPLANKLIHDSNVASINEGLELLEEFIFKKFGGSSLLSSYEKGSFLINFPDKDLGYRDGLSIVNVTENEFHMSTTRDVFEDAIEFYFDGIAKLIENGEFEDARKYHSVVDGEYGVILYSSRKLSINLSIMVANLGLGHLHVCDINIEYFLTKLVDIDGVTESERDSLLIFLARYMCAKEKFSDAVKLLFLNKNISSNPVKKCSLLMEIAVVVAAVNKNFQCVEHILDEAVSTWDYIDRMDMFVVLSALCSEDDHILNIAKRIILSGRYFSGKCSLAKIWIGCELLYFIDSRVICKKMVTFALNSEISEIPYYGVFKKRLSEMADLM